MRRSSINVPFFRHDLNARHGQAILDVLETPFLTSGPIGKSVEGQLRSYFGTEHSFLVNSWTNGAVAALLALGVGPGDEVIVPAMTFVATANVVELLGAKPVFVDVDPRTLLMTPEGVSAALTARTKAVIPVHLYGQMVDLPGIRAALKGREDVAILEDCAHCFEGTRRGRKPGQDSDLAIFSFYATKNVTCGEGGAIITNRSDLAEKIVQTRLHGMSAGAADRFKGGGYNHWDVCMLGVKANLPDLLAALLPHQIEEVDAKRRVREQLDARYRAAFAPLGIRMPELLQDSLSAHHIFPIHVDPSRRDKVIGDLNSRGVSVTVNYRSVPLLTYYQEKYALAEDQLPVSSEWGAGTLTLPFFPSMTSEQQDHVIQSVLDCAPILESTHA